MAVEVEATEAVHLSLAREPVSIRVEVLEVDLLDLQLMPRRRLSVELVLEEVDLVEVLPGVMVEVDSLGELPEVVTGTLEAAIHLRTAMADRVVVLREVSRMLVRAALPVQVPDQLEEVVTLEVDQDQREDRLALGPERDPSVDRVVTEEVTPRK